MPTVQSTYTPTNALAFAKLFVKNSPIDNATIGPQICDAANRMLWMAAPWSWTLGVFTPTTIVAATQAYTLTDPNDFLRFEWAGRSTANDRMEDLEIVSMVPTDTSYKQVPKKIAFTSVSSGINYRVWPTPAAADGRIFIIYKKVATKIVTAGMSSVLTFPDEFFHVFENAVLWKAMIYTQDPRAKEQFEYVQTLLASYRNNEPPLMSAMGLEV